MVVGSVAVSEKGSCSYFHTFGRYSHGNLLISDSINLHFLICRMLKEYCFNVMQMLVNFETEEYFMLLMSGAQC